MGPKDCWCEIVPHRRPVWVSTASVQAEDRKEGLVDSPHLLGREMADEGTQTPAVHRSDLFDENFGRLARHVHLGAKRRGPSTARRRGDEHNRAREELIGLNDDAESLLALFVADPLGQPEPIYVTAEHEELP
jgi:hypothetical protein